MDGSIAHHVNGREMLKHASSGTDPEGADPLPPAVGARVAPVRALNCP